MSSILSPSNALFLANVQRIQQQVAQANMEMSSGKKVQVAADAPAQISQLLQLRADEAHNQQIESNLTLANTEAQSADSALSSGINILQRATQLATEGANGTQTADTRLSLAEEVQSLMEQMVSISQTQVQGRYIFSGDQDTSPSFQLDLTATDGEAVQTGVDQLTTAGATRLIEDPAGGTFAATQTAQDIFNDTIPASTDADGNTIPAAPAADNVFAALNGLRIALLNNDQPSIQSSIDSLNAASQHLNDAEAFYGTVEDRIQSASNFASSYDVQLQTEIGNIQDADPTTAALLLSQCTTQLQAAFQMQAKMPTQTLFDFLG